MSDVTTKAIGKAVYMEMRRHSQTVQIILMPEVVILGGSRTVPMSLYRRTISESAPRRTWKQLAGYGTRAQNTRGVLAFEQLDREEALATFPERVLYYNNFFKSLVTYGYQLYKQPIVVEVTEKDAVDAFNSKTPYKVLGRVTRCRKHLEFGESLYAT